MDTTNFPLLKMKIKENVEGNKSLIFHTAKFKDN